MSLTTQKRAELRRQARQRQRELIPRMRAQVKKLRAAKKKRLTKCRTDCRKRKARVQRDAIRARQLLRERIARSKAKATELCGTCRVTATGKALEKIDRAMAEVAAEREAIRELRMRAERLKDSRGQAGGRRAAELREESDAQVARDVADDPDLAELWRTVDRRKFPGTSRTTRTEQFLDWIEHHPHVLDEQRARQHAQWDAEAERLFSEWPRERATGQLSEAELAELHRELDRVQQFADEEVPF